MCRTIYHNKKRQDIVNLTLLRYSIFLQSMRKMLSEKSSLWWMLALLCTNDNDDPPLDCLKKNIYKTVKI